jgi:two-component system, chemotaxis family, chemotaxis protein CheY
MKKILIVDDSSTIRDQIKIAFAAKSEYQLVEAENGVQALEKLAATEGIRLVISDVNMPEMDGITMVKRIAADDKLKSIPIVMLTTEVSKELKEVAKTCGVRAWMVKPFQADKLVMAADQLTK